jgi:hypothetical protein
MIKYPIISDDCQIVSGAHSATSSLDTGDFFTFGGGGGEAGY